MNDKERADEAEEALRQICIDHLNFDPSDGEGTSPDEVVELLQAHLSQARQTIKGMREVIEGEIEFWESDVALNSFSISQCQGTVNRLRTAIDASIDQAVKGGEGK